MQAVDKRISQKSWRRLFRQFSFLPFIHDKWLTPALKERLEYCIAHAESGHRGEICVIVENRLPILLAYHQDCATRAVNLFSEYRVWDTEANMGILIYVNLCEHHLQIVADRGIHHKMPHGYWEDLCQTALQDFKLNKIEEGLLWLIEVAGDLLRTHYPNSDNHNELMNAPLHI